MSTKTMTKRVALATVVALGAGVLSLVSVSSASAASLTLAQNQALAGGITIDTTSAGANASIGLLSASLTTAGSASSTSPDVFAATILNTGTLKFLTASVAASAGYYTVSAGGYFSADGASSGATYINGGQNVDSATAAAGTLAARHISVAVNGAVGSTFTINGYVDSTKAVLTSTLVVTIAGSSVAGTASAAKSNIWWSGTATNNQGLTSDLSTGSATTTGLPLYLQVQINDAYGNAVTSTSGALTVVASGSANVSIGAAASSNSTSGTYSTAVSNAAPGDLVVKVTEATAGAGWSGTVTVTYNGAVLATKSGTISGLPAKIVGAAVAIGTINATVDSAVSYQVYDAAGNVVVVAPASIALTSSSNTTAVTGILAASGGATYASNSSTAAGLLKVTGGTTAGTSSLVLQTTLSNGTVVTSNAFNATVGNTATSYTATLDKSKYAPGDIATLKVKFLDSKGNAASSASSLYTVTSGAWNATLTLPQFTLVGTTGVSGMAAAYGASGNVAPDATGTITLKYSVGTTGGSYNAIVDFPTVDAAGGAAQAVSYSVSDGSTSLNDVLKGIVSLIASINKQIAALAKLVTKK